jgi:dimethylaniline monooxygenase (N-oxide forming)
VAQAERGGRVQPVGPTIPLAEIQGRWIARALIGDVVLPDARAMAEEIAAHRRYVRAKFVTSERYRLEVDYRTYAEQLAHDMAV